MKFIKLKTLVASLSVVGLAQAYATVDSGGRDRNAGYPAPLAQIPAGAANAHYVVDNVMKLLGNFL